MSAPPEAGPPKAGPSTKLDITLIQQLLPHRYPFLLLDRVVAFQAGESLDAIKNVTINEPFFRGHFPAQPIMPGVLLLEAMVQACGLLVEQTLRSQGVKAQSGLFYLAGVDKARFRRPVVPGDQVLIRARYGRERGTFYLMSARAEVEGKRVADADFMTTRSATGAPVAARD